MSLVVWTPFSSSLCKWREALSVFQTRPPPLGIVRGCTCALAFSSGYISKMKMKPERGILLFNPRWRDLSVGSVCLKLSRQCLHKHEIHSTCCASHSKYCAREFLDRVLVQSLSQSLPFFSSLKRGNIDEFCYKRTHLNFGILYILLRYRFL